MALKGDGKETSYYVSIKTLWYWSIDPIQTRNLR